MESRKETASAKKASGAYNCTQAVCCRLLFLLMPFNIASYALLLMMVAQVTGLEAGEFVHTLGDAHIYTNHFEQVEEQLKRDPRKLPTMRINPDVKSIFDFKYEDFTLEDYNPHPHIKGIVVA